MTNNGKQENNLIEKEIEAVKILLNGWSRQIILTGPPGTSKTYSAKRIANCLINLKIQPGKPVDDQQIGNYLQDLNGKATINGDKCDIVQFHPSYNYEDFVRGIEVKNPSGRITYETVDKILGKMAERAMKSALELNYNNPIKLNKLIEKYQQLKAEARRKEDGAEEKLGKAPLHVLIIDEINRAPLASVLGELIYALEYRGDSVTTPYTVDDDSQHLVIPDNLIIIGTMNTADRSIGSIDYAVRRRFTFINLPPDEEVIKDWYGKLKKPEELKKLELEEPKGPKTPDQRKKLKQNKLDERKKLEQNKKELEKIEEQLKYITDIIDIIDIIDMETKAPALFNAVGELFNGKKPDDKEPKVDNPSGKQTDQKNDEYMDPEFYAEDVQIGHTYFLAKSDAELKHKFIYQVIPVLKEYIKDGILISKGGNNPCLELKITKSSPTDTTDKPIYLSESFNKIKGEIESCWSEIYVG